MNDTKPLLTTTQIIPYIKSKNERQRMQRFPGRYRTLNKILVHFVTEKINKSPLLQKEKPLIYSANINQPIEPRIERKKSIQGEIEKYVVETEIETSGKLRIPLPVISSLKTKREPKSAPRPKSKQFSLVRLKSTPKLSKFLTAENSPILEREILKTERIKYSSVSLLTPIGKLHKSRGLSLDDSSKEQTHDFPKYIPISKHLKLSRQSVGDLVSAYLTET